MKYVIMLKVLPSLFFFLELSDLSIIQGGLIKRSIQKIALLSTLSIASLVSAADKSRILCFGDSITAVGKWVESVGQDELFETINAGRSGRKAAEAKKDLAGYLDKYKNLDGIIMVLGVNDLPARDPRPGDVKVATCVANMSVAIDLALTRFKSQFKPAPKGWQQAVKAVEYPASIDGSRQPMLVYTAESKEKRPLLVGLHTWSSNYTQAGGETVYARWCIERNWHFIHPHFRGPNWTPDACGSHKVVQDIIDAVEYMKKHCSVDADRIYLVGASGGGYASLLMAARAPDIWAGVSAWVPISDIRAWWEQKTFGGNSPQYAKHIEKAVGGRPDQSEKAARECVKRSPLTYLCKAAGVNLDINAGVTDGHKGGSVPFSHSLYAFNQVVPEKDRIPVDAIEEFYEKQLIPPSLPKADEDPLYGKKKVIFRKVSNNTRVSIFQGRHEIIHHAALNWLASQQKAKSAVWNVKTVHNLKTGEDESASGK